MNRLALALAVVGVAIGCTKDHAEPRAATDAPRAIAAEHHLPIATTPQQLFDDFTRPDADGLVLLDKYAGGVTFTATIKTVGVDEDGAAVVWIDIDGENVMSLDFASPAPQGLRAAVPLTVTCKIGGASGALMMVTACIVRDV